MNDSPDTLPIHDDDAEQRLLFVLFRCDDVAVRREIFDRVKPDAWFVQQHRAIADAARAVHDAGVESHPAFVKATRDELERRGELAGLPDGDAYLIHLAQVLPSGSGWVYYVDRVLECWRRRWIDREARTLAQAAAALDVDPIGTARKTAERLARFVERATTAPTSTDTGADSLASQIVRASRGELKSVAWPWAALTDYARALRPGTLTMLAGGAGDSKSFLLLEALVGWIDRGYQASGWMLEETHEFYTARALAQLARNSNLADPDWCGRNVSASMKAIHEHTHLIDRVAKCLRVTTGTSPTLDEVADWITIRAEAGDRLIIVDPVTKAKTSNSRFNDDERVVDRVASVVRKTGASVVVVTHPPKLAASARPTLSDLAGGAAWSRFAQCVLFLRRIEPAKRLRVIDPTAGLQCNATANRELHLLKCRNGSGTGKTIAYWFAPESLTFSECGVVVKPPKSEGKATKESSEQDGADESTPPMFE